MSGDVEKILKDLLAEQVKTLEEQKLTSLYTMTLERDRLFGALTEAGLGAGVVTANEFSLAPGATATVVQLVPAGNVYLIAGEGRFYTSLPWWVSYSFWVDQTAPAVPFATATRMPEELAIDTRGIIPIRGFMVHTCTNLHVAQAAYAMIKNLMLMVSTETWEMIRRVYLDAFVKEIRKKALEISGIER